VTPEDVDALGDRRLRVATDVQGSIAVGVVMTALALADPGDEEGAALLGWRAGGIPGERAIQHATQA
jgi:hypothetical protein